MSRKKYRYIQQGLLKGRKRDRKNLIEIAPSLLVYTRLVKIIPQSRSFLRAWFVLARWGYLFLFFFRSFSLSHFTRFLVFDQARWTHTDPAGRSGAQCVPVGVRSSSRCPIGGCVGHSGLAQSRTRSACSHSWVSRSLSSDGTNTLSHDIFIYLGIENRKM